MATMLLPSTARPVWLHFCVLPDGTRLPASYRATLSGTETARYGALGQQADREAFAAARGLARVALMLHSGQDLSGISLPANGMWKKPSALGCGDWRVSITHSRGIIAIAVAEGIELGVDIEAGDRRISESDLARTHYAAAEASALAIQPPAQTRNSFYRLWSAKEALAKAAGGNLERMLATDLSPLLAHPRLTVGAWAVECVLASPHLSCAVAAPRPWELVGKCLWTVAQIAARLSAASDARVLTQEGGGGYKPDDE